MNLGLINAFLLSVLGVTVHSENPTFLVCFSGTFAFVSLASLTLLFATMLSLSSPPDILLLVIYISSVNGLLRCVS